MSALKAETLFSREVISSLFIMNEQLKNFGRNVKAQLTHQGLAGSELAKKAGIAPKTLNNLLNGRHAPQFDVLDKLAKALKVELWQLWLPEFPADAAHDETFPRLIETASKLTPAARKAVARMADLELQAGRRN